MTKSPMTIPCISWPWHHRTTKHRQAPLSTAMPSAGGFTMHMQATTSPSSSCRNVPGRSVLVEIRMGMLQISQWLNVEYNMPFFFGGMSDWVNHEAIFSEYNRWMCIKCHKTVGMSWNGIQCPSECWLIWLSKFSHFHSIASRWYWKMFPQWLHQ